MTLTQAQAAARIGELRGTRRPCSATMRRWAAEGVLRPIPSGYSLLKLYRQADVEAFALGEPFSQPWADLERRPEPQRPVVRLLHASRLTRVKRR